MYLFDFRDKLDRNVSSYFNAVSAKCLSYWWSIWNCYFISKRDLKAAQIQSGLCWVLSVVCRQISPVKVILFFWSPTISEQGNNNTESRVCWMDVHGTCPKWVGHVWWISPSLHLKDNIAAASNNIDSLQGVVVVGRVGGGGGGGGRRGSDCIVVGF